MSGFQKKPLLIELLHHSPTSAGHSWVKECLEAGGVTHSGLCVNGHCDSVHRHAHISVFEVYTVVSEHVTVHIEPFFTIWEATFCDGSDQWMVSNNLIKETALTATWVPVFQQKCLSQTCLYFLQELKHIFKHLSINEPKILSHHHLCSHFWELGLDWTSRITVVTTSAYMSVSGLAIH